MQKLNGVAALTDGMVRFVFENPSCIETFFLHWRYILATMCTCAVVGRTRRDVGYAVLRDKNSIWFRKVNKGFVACGEYKKTGN